MAQMAQGGPKKKWFINGSNGALMTMLAKTRQAILLISLDISNKED